MPNDHDDIANMYRDAFGKFGRTSASVLCPKGRQHMRYAAMFAPFDIEGKSILDFGCGLGDLYGFLSGKAANFSYTGVDLVEEFIASNLVNVPGANFRRISGVADLDGTWDLIAVSGVFNLRYKSDFRANRDCVFGLIEELFRRCTIGMSIDFLTAKVDFEAERAFHVPAGDVLNFALERLGRRVLIDHSYLPYEYTLTVLKNDDIDRHNGVYRGR